MTKSRISMIIIWFCSAAAAFEPELGKAAPVPSVDGSGWVMYPHFAVGGASAAAYTVRTVFFLAGSGDDILFAPVGGLYLLSSTIAKGGTIAQGIKLKRLGDHSYKKRLTGQLGLYGLTLASYTATLLIGLGSAIGQSDLESELKLSMSLTSALMCLTYWNEISVFRANRRSIGAYPRTVDDTRFTLEPVVTFGKNAPGAGLVASLRF